MTIRAEIRIALEMKPLPIPYPAVKRDDGENFGYRSLLVHPDAIDEIPELQGEMPMKNFVAAINSPGGIFETVRLVHWIDQSPSNVGQCLCLGLIFRDRSLFANYGKCMAFAGHLLQQVASGSVQLDLAPLLEIQPAHLTQEEVSGWIMDIYLGGYGANEDEARQRLAQVLGSIGPLLGIVA